MQRRTPGRGIVVVAALALSALSGGCLGHGRHQQIVHVPPPGTVPTELNPVTLPPYVIGPKDGLLIEVVEAGEDDEGRYEPRDLIPQRIQGQHLVGVDGTVNLGYYGNISLTGMTMDQAREAVKQFITPKLDSGIDPEKLIVVVDVITYNSKSYFVITDGAGFGEQVFKFPVQGQEFVLDALANVQGIPAVGSKRNIWVARRSPAGGPDQILPVDWVGTTQHGITATNWQLFPGDRVYVKAQRLVTVNNTIDKILAPIDRLLGSILLGSSTANSIQGQGFFGGGGS